jgi:preprotein translocase subunit Sss1
VLFLSLSEYRKIAIASVIGFLLMGFIGFVVKLVFIPVNNLILLG